MDECIFCKIARGEILSKKIWEDENFLAVLDVKPVGEGHTLIIPKKHFENLLDLDTEISLNYIGALQKTAKILMNKYKSSGFNIVLNNGKVAGQIVGHVHFHLLPRREGDNMRGIFIG
ncbi:MAG: HIT family protein [Candidatus Pacearchaeota archaeon]